MSDSIDDCLLRLHPADPVAIAKRSLQPGERLARAAGGSLTVLDEVPAGHKLALVDLASGQPVLRYGYPIGFAEGPIRAGSWVHTHNLGVGEPAPAGSYRLAGPVEPKPSRRTFAGFLRPGGRVGTRNYIAVIATVSCSANLASQVARAFPPQRLAAYPNVDGVIALVHTSGCGLPPGSRSHAYLRRVLANMAKHPNVAAAVFVGLGCELLQVDDCQPLYTPQEIERLAPLGLVIQESGGFQKSLAAGIAQVEQLLPQVNALQRTPQPLAALTLALQCGGSDGWSGVTANPLVGRVADAIVLEGGTAVLGETPEIFGAEHLLTSRVSAPEVAEKLFERMRWWLEQARLRGFEINNNPAPGNKKGGLTNIFEKSLGAVAKAGSTPLNDVFEYDE
jgi:altronate dehydratase